MQGRRYDLRPGKTWARASYLFTLAVVLPGTLTTLPRSAMADSVRTSALPPGSETFREADLPTIVAPIEGQRYRRIFVLQNVGRLAEADREILDLTDKLLLGAVEAQRLLHKGYRATYRELAAWLDQHADEPPKPETHRYLCRQTAQDTQAQAPTERAVFFRRADCCLAAPCFRSACTAAV